MILKRRRPGMTNRHRLLSSIRNGKGKKRERERLSQNYNKSASKMSLIRWNTNVKLFVRMVSHLSSLEVCSRSHLVCALALNFSSMWNKSIFDVELFEGRSSLVNDWLLSSLDKFERSNVPWCTLPRGVEDRNFYFQSPRDASDQN